MSSTATARKIAQSINQETGTVITTFEIDFPRIILSEFNTHRVFSRNTSSSRAIPATNVVERLENSMFIPEYWGKNQSGMQAKEELDVEARTIAFDIWLDTGRQVIEATKKLARAGLHKQLTNRISEAFQTVKVCMTATELKNFVWLRDHSDAQPEMEDLAKAIRSAYLDGLDSTINLSHGDWHLPYYRNGVWIEHSDGVDSYGMTLEDARKISISCCAQTSYRKNDDTLEKADNLFKMFFETDHIHASPAEHCATPLAVPIVDLDAPLSSAFGKDNEGATHVDKFGNVWSNNFKHWLQYRSLIPNNVVLG